MEYDITDGGEIGIFQSYKNSGSNYAKLISKP